MFSIVWKLIILYLCESNIEFYMRVKEIPILLLTGYLGSGKTTLVNHILSNKRGIKFAVIVNDIGEVNIDADLIQKGGIVGKKDESLVALQNGCICCTLKMDLVEQIDDIMKLERFDYIVIEASGVCEPAPIAQTICSISSMENTYGGCRLDCIVTVVDALRLQSEFSCGNDLTRKGIDEEDIENLIIQQIEFCNVVLLNKVSEVKHDELERIKQIIRTLQPAAEIIECDYADVDLNKIIYTEVFDFERTATSAGWIRGIESALTEEQKKERRNTRTIIIMRVVKWMNMVSVLLCIIVVRLLISINSIVLYQPDGVVISFVQKESVISAIIVICLFFLSRLVCRKS